MVSVFRGKGGPAATIQGYLDDLVGMGKLVWRKVGNRGGKEYALAGTPIPNEEKDG
jgi:hypothetical protein